jgi:hypothetical protein
VILSIEERVFVVECFFREGSRYSDLVQEQFAEKSVAISAVTAYIRNISQEDLQKVFVNKINRVQACTDARGHHFQPIL